MSKFLKIGNSAAYIKSEFLTEHGGSGIYKITGLSLQVKKNVFTKIII